MEEGFVECTLFYCFYEKMAYVTETLKSHLADFTSVSQLVSQNEKVHTRWGWPPPEDHETFLFPCATAQQGDGLEKELNVVTFFIICTIKGESSQQPLNYYATIMKKGLSIQSIKLKRLLLAKIKDILEK